MLAIRGINCLRNNKSIGANKLYLETTNKLSISSSKKFFHKNIREQSSSKRYKVTNIYSISF